MPNPGGLREARSILFASCQFWVLVLLWLSLSRLASSILLQVLINLTLYVFELCSISTLLHTTSSTGEQLFQCMHPSAKYSRGA
jgi:hypothetical protein